jgi:hypothetical protein
VVWQRRLNERRHRGGKRDETTPVVLMRILLGQKMKKIHAVDLIVTIGR